MEETGIMIDLGYIALIVVGLTIFVAATIWGQRIGK
jgi:hypothetical protein